METKRYEIELTGVTPLLMHRDNLVFSEKIKKWQKDPVNKEQSISGDDRSPAWTWIGYCYDDSHHIGIDSDNLMTMFREGGAKVPNKGKETYKKQTQSGINLDQAHWPILVNGKPVSVKPINKLIGDLDFSKHLETAESLGFELFVKRATIRKAKHVRVRPMFREWTVKGTITIVDEELSGLTKDVLQKILTTAGALCGLCDWRPSSPSASGIYGRFTATVKELNG